MAAQTISDPKGSKGLFCVQLLIVAAAIGLLALMPPRRGPMIVLPLLGGAAKPWLDDQKNITLLGIGRIPGSIVVAADRDALLPHAIAHGALLLPALPVLCMKTVE